MEVINKVASIYLVENTATGSLISYDSFSGEARYVKSGRKLSASQKAPVIKAAKAYVAYVAKQSFSAVIKTQKGVFINLSTNTISFASDPYDLQIRCNDKAEAKEQAESRVITLPHDQLHKITALMGENDRARAIRHYIQVDGFEVLYHPVTGILELSDQYGDSEAFTWQNNRITGSYMVDSKTGKQTFFKGAL